MERMSFEKLLEQAKSGDKNAQEEIFRMYRPLLIKNAMGQNRFEEDLYQELSATLLNCIRKFQI
jgi:DNA-directed RNA polymerase specialized sigma subunit